jgi:heme-degrading monooxygenase HmoA
MLIKWISCEVTDHQGFDLGQRAWRILDGQPGFIGQGGGWSRHRPHLAHVFSCWTDREHYLTFMNSAHDRVAARQAATFRSIEVNLFARLLDIGTPMRGDITGASVLRVAHCRVRSGRQSHFMTAQTKVWNPGMTASPGMLGGLFAGDGKADFLVLTMWRSIADHERYRMERFPELRHRAAVTDDLDHLGGDLIDVEHAWQVRGEH